MVRRYYRRRPRYHSRRLKTVKWSVENYISRFDIDGNQLFTQPIITPINTLGVRKIKNFTFSASVTEVVAFALVFVPEGTNSSPLALGVNQIVSAYEPNQNVIMKGILIPSQPQNFFSRLARNLNSGDTIVLLLDNATNNDTNVFVSLSYAISFN